MDFTREPIVETVITPREGYRLVIRNSKTLGQEEHFVDAVEIVSFGNAFFFRSVERPKPFMVPVGDYEVLEVRESRIVLKSPSAQEGQVKVPSPERKPQRQPQPQPQQQMENIQYQESERPQAQPQEARFSEGKVDGRIDKRRDRRRGFRRRRGGPREEGAPRDDGYQDEGGVQGAAGGEGQDIGSPEVGNQSAFADERRETTSPEVYTSTNLLRTVLPPPTTLIRDDLQRLRDSEVYRGAFFMREEAEQDDDDSSLESFQTPKEVSFAETKESSQEEPFLVHKAVEEAGKGNLEDNLS